MKFIILQNNIYKKGDAMTKKLEFYRCNICGNIVQIMFEGEGSLVCCGHDMELIELKNDSADIMLEEKHSPKIKFENGNYVAYIDNHPMTKDHYIMMIQTVSIDENEIKTKYFYPNDNVEICSGEYEKISAYSYCNIHGLYKNKEEK